VGRLAVIRGRGRHGSHDHAAVSGFIGSQAFNDEPDAELLERFIALIGDRPLDVHIAREFTFDQIPAAHHALRDHHLGKLAIAIG
jgi:NADPH:quinone reductase